MSTLFPYSNLHHKAHTFFAFILAILFCTCSGLTAYAQPRSDAPAAVQIQVIAIIGNKISVVINGATPKTMRIGEQIGEVKFLALNGQIASFQVPDAHLSKRVNIRLSQAIQANSKKNGVIKIKRTENGMFYTSIMINHVDIPAMIDTGATNIVISAQDAQRIGLDYKKGKKGRSGTANGVTDSYNFNLPSATVENVTIDDISLTVLPNMVGRAMLGQSFLKHFKVVTKGDEMILSPRH